VIDHYIANLIVDSNLINLHLWDTTDKEEDRKLRYTESNVILICYSVSSHASLENAKSKWYPEVKKHCPSVPIFLCATKIDLRDDTTFLESLKAKKLNLVTRKEAERVARDIGAVHAETSCLTSKGLKDCYDNAIRSVLKAKN
jgi:Ras-related C3 botulinum toxin substrate 1